jgi:hypothetical protein
MRVKMVRGFFRPFSPLSYMRLASMDVYYEKQKEKEKKICLSPGSNWGPLVCETNVITNYTTQTSC